MQLDNITTADLIKELASRHENHAQGKHLIDGFAESYCGLEHHEFNCSIEDYCNEELIDELDDRGFHVRNNFSPPTLRDDRYESMFDWIRENKSIEEMSALLNQRF